MPGHPGIVPSWQAGSAAGACGQTAPGTPGAARASLPTDLVPLGSGRASVAGRHGVLIGFGSWAPSPAGAAASHRGSDSPGVPRPTA
jgi:hypothetical protein